MNTGRGGMYNAGRYMHGPPKNNQTVYALGI